MATDVVGIPTAPERRGPTLTQRASLNAIASLLDYAAKLVVGFVVTPIVVAGLGRSLFGDRKSTRLNSSHSSISYAVFCLKKKKKKKTSQNNNEYLTQSHVKHRSMSSH